MSQSWLAGSPLPLPGCSDPAFTLDLPWGAGLVLLPLLFWSWEAAPPYLPGPTSLGPPHAPKPQLMGVPLKNLFPRVPKVFPQQ